MKKIYLSQPTFFLTLLILVGVFFLFPLSSHAAGPNLIPNSNLEITDSSGLPQNWIKGRWGTNTTIFEYPVNGIEGSKAAKVSITSYMSGDAKWKHQTVLVTPGHEYQFIEYYKSNISSYITLQFLKNDGTFSYKDLVHPAPVDTFTQVRLNFVVPTNTVAVTIFHLINQVGTLTVDAFELKDVTPQSPPPPTDENLILNPSLEYVNSSNQPIGWIRGRWGTNNTEFIFPTAGAFGKNAAKVQINSYRSGDAKWYFDDVAVTGDSAYQFSDWYKGNINSSVTVRFKRHDGSYLFIDLGTTEATSVWSEFKKPFTAPEGALSLTVFHLIKGIGSLETDNFILKKLNSDPTKFSKGMVSLNFDDGWRSAYENALPILDAAGFKSTQYIITERLSPTFPGYVRSSEVLDMQTRGHEIGAHTRTHPNLTTLTEEQMRSEIIGSKNDLLEIGIRPVDFFAYPLGAYNDQVISVVKEAGFEGARCSDGGYNQKTQSIWTLRRQPMTNATTLNEVKGYIDKATADKTWVVLLFHEVNNTGHQYAVTPELFQEIVNYLKEKNITPIPMSEGIAQMNQ